jgi:hypothetical protein
MAATSTRPAPETIDKSLPSAIFRHWVHVREEDTKAYEVYKPAGSPMPPAFGRDGFEMRKDGRFIQYLIGPADAPVPAYGHWRLAGKLTVAVDLAEARQQDFSFQIVDVDTRELKIRRIPVVAGPPMDDPHQPDMGMLPPAQSHRRIDFEKAAVRVFESFPPQRVLVVSGVKPYMNMAVELVPVVYIRQPEYWEIEVVGSLRGVGLPAQERYTVSLNLAASTGSKGIVVMGATRLQRFNVPQDAPTDDPAEK